MRSVLRTLQPGVFTKDLMSLGHRADHKSIPGREDLVVTQRAHAFFPHLLQFFNQLTINGISQRGELGPFC